jgi:RNA polymerase sigma factor (sigma-70 family)
MASREHPPGAAAGPSGPGVDAQVERAQRLDRELAEQLGRAAPVRAGGAAGYLDALDRRPLLPPQRERELVLAAKAGDAAARARLVEAFMPLIGSVARTYRGVHVQRVELLQEGVVGLLRALDGFDPERATPLWAYASWWVRQAMQQLVSELTRPVVLSDRALRNLARLKEAHREAVRRSGREPDGDELADRAGLSADQVQDLLATERVPRSLQEPAGADDRSVGTFGELLVDPLAEGEYERVLDAVQVRELHALLAGLSDRERNVVRLRYGIGGEELSLREVGDRLGVSGERVRQIEQRALGKLAAAMGDGAAPG